MAELVRELACVRARRAAGRTAGSLLREAAVRLRDAGIRTARLDAEVLLAHVLGWRRETLYTHPDRVVDDRAVAEFEAAIQKRLARVPVAYIRSKKEFMSLEFTVTPAVLIPRPETEVLVESVISRLEGKDSPLIMDLGTGSGAIAVALAKFLSAARIVATDISPAALSVARLNAGRYGLQDRIHFEVGDLFEPLHAGEHLGRSYLGSFDAIVSNPPYISRGEMKELAPELSYEPRIALDGGQDGLDFFRKILAGARSFLKSSGFIALEISNLRAQEVKVIADGLGYSTSILPDYSGRDRVLIAGGVL
ncbi:MAG TPA: peptide chain release factor N(5)-glutamine methyltransferase [Firmicutes bacterium]|nr:peptide chain release factor N(5)-glutamine methyltransferase [Bacillota bacterium]